MYIYTYVCMYVCTYVCILYMSQVSIVSQATWKAFSKQPAGTSPLLALRRAQVASQVCVCRWGWGRGWLEGGHTYAFMCVCVCVCM